MAKQTASARRAAKTAKAEAKKAEAKAKRTAKAELEEIGKQIAARVTIMRDYDAAAEEKAGHDLRKAQDERDTINNVLLVQARAKCKEAGESFEKFRKQYCPDLSRSRLYTVLAIADGRKTVEQDRAEKRESVAKSRAKVSSTSAVGDTPRVPRVATPNGTTLDTSGFSPKALEQIVKVTRNDVDTEASAETRKAAASETDPGEAATSETHRGEAAASSEPEAPAETRKAAASETGRHPQAIPGKQHNCDPLKANGKALLGGVTAPELPTAGVGLLALLTAYIEKQERFTGRSGSNPPSAAAKETIIAVISDNWSYLNCEDRAEVSAFLLKQKGVKCR